MEKLKIGNYEYDLIVNGVQEDPSRKSRKYTIETEVPHDEIVTAFSDVSNIQCITESGEVLAGYYDGVHLKTISSDYENGTHTIEVSVDTLTAEIRELKALLAK